MNSAKISLSKVTGAVVVIPAAGVGKRFGGNIPKQYQTLNGNKILEMTLLLFLSSPRIEKVLLVVNPKDEEYRSLPSISNEKILIVNGADERQDSVENGIKYLHDCGLPNRVALLVHDAVRPCLSLTDLDLLLDFFEKNKQPCYLAEPVSDSLKKINASGKTTHNLERDNVMRALTPQMARFSELKAAYQFITANNSVVTDEVSVLLQFGLDVFAVIAKDFNLKITHKKDLVLAEQIMKSRE